MMNMYGADGIRTHGRQQSVPLRPQAGILDHSRDKIVFCLTRLRPHSGVGKSRLYTFL